ncbi:hypothetical protein [Gynurincola endophyticus]|uniref:hypothetical protein n=1 Tax=Gynurincola endophyticus TaxID=2479004 RepID=UPI000F8E991C|nr:hypothetical protein [Gynurincola endophyticus]
MKYLYVSLLSLLFTQLATAQELYIFTEPASNLPAKSVNAKWSTKWQNDEMMNRTGFRHSQDIGIGLHKNWMVMVGNTFSSMYQDAMKWESARLYTKYRFLSIDDSHSHFRMAAFAEGSYSKNPLRYDHLSLMGDQSGVRGGVVLTQLWNKLAVSSTLDYMQVLNEKDRNLTTLPYQAFNYSLSAGYLLFPRTYKSYDQTNLNLYVEVLGQSALDQSKNFVDIAPALQLIFKSSSKLNVGYRMQASGNMNRMAQNSWLVSFETLFLNVLRKK